ncbi:MAG TPA: hypothetical protein DHV28_16240, partial [Ignavibacteriales bacterium]|nr:hypothetical protein [Ignavibacteriales bacterium]
MVIRLTRKLADKIKIKSLPEYDEGSVIEEWYGHIFIADRVQYMLFTNAFSLYSVLFPGKGINDIKTFFETAFHYLSETLKTDGYGNMVGRFITDKIEIIDVCKTNNRGILGSMNDMIAHSKFYFTGYKMTPTEISRRLNEMPYSYL